MNSVSSW